MVYLAWLALLGFAAISFFFALAETSLFSLGRWRARQLGEKFQSDGLRVQSLLSAPHDLLATIVLGNTFANAFMVAVLLWITPEEHALLAKLTMAALLVLILFGCEVIPKTLAVRNPEVWALRVAKPMRFLTLATRPIRSIVQWINAAILATAARRSIRPTVGLTDEEYKELVDLAYQQGTLGASEKEIILQIIALDHRTAQEVMKPRAQMACVSDDSPVAEMIVIARKYRHRRLPIYDEDPDTIVGVLNAQSLLMNPQMDLADAIEFPSFVPASMNLLQLLRSLQRQQRGMAIVLDEFGGTAGIVTVEDILEEVVGDIRSEGEPQGFVMEKLGEGRWRVNATMRLDDFQREYPALGDWPGVETMGGLVLALMEVVPQTGETTTFRGLQLKVTAADERRVRELLVEKIVPTKTKGATP